jgi:uncharacterized membrane protein
MDWLALMLLTLAVTAAALAIWLIRSIPRVEDDEE